MARPYSDPLDSSDDEFPDLNSLANWTTQKLGSKPSGAQPEKPAKSPAKASAKTPLRRRKLGQLAGNALLQPWGNDGKHLGDSGASSLSGGSGKITRPRVQLRARKEKQVVVAKAIQDDDEAHLSAEEGASLVDEAPLEDSSEFQDTAAFDSNTDDEDTFDDIFSKPPAKGKTLTEKTRPSPTKARQPRQRSGSPAFGTLKDEALRRDLGGINTKESNDVGVKSKTKGMRSKQTDKLLPRQTSGKTRRDDDLPTAFSNLRM